MNQLQRWAALALAGLGLPMACGGDNEGTGPNPGITVLGLVHDRVGEPISGAAVVVPGKSPVATGADGRFSIAGVQVPYDIAMSLSGQNTAVVYKGLRRIDPTLLHLNTTGAEKAATISGTTPAAPGKTTFVFFFAGRHVFGGTAADTVTGQYSFTVPWRESANTHAGQLYVLRWERSPSASASYDGYASRPLTITAGGTSPGNEFAASDLTDPPEQSISGTVAVPAGYTLSERRLYAFFGRVPLFWAAQSPSAAFTYTVPAVPGVTFGVGALAGDPSSRSSFSFKSGISGNSTNVSILLQPAARLALPVNGSTAVDPTTSFDWTSGGGTGVNLFEAIPDNPSHPSYFVWTTQANEKLPDLGVVGMSLPVAAGYHWVVYREFPVASIDDAADVAFLRWADLEAGDVGESRSEEFIFTTQAPAGTRLQARGPRPTATAPQGSLGLGWVRKPAALWADAP